MTCWFKFLPLYTLEFAQNFASQLVLCLCLRQAQIFILQKGHRASFVTATHPFLGAPKGAKFPPFCAQGGSFYFFLVAKCNPSNEKKVIFSYSFSQGRGGPAQLLLPTFHVTSYST